MKRKCLLSMMSYQCFAMYGFFLSFEATAQLHNESYSFTIVKCFCTNGNKFKILASQQASVIVHTNSHSNRNLNWIENNKKISNEGKKERINKRKPSRTIRSWSYTCFTHVLWYDFDPLAPHHRIDEVIGIHFQFTYI